MHPGTIHIQLIRHKREILLIAEFCNKENQRANLRQFAGCKITEVYNRCDTPIVYTNELTEPQKYGDIRPVVNRYKVFSNKREMLTSHRHHHLRHCCPRQKNYHHRNWMKAVCWPMKYYHLDQKRRNCPKNRHRYSYSRLHIGPS